jgi:hypothetical protein
MQSPTTPTKDYLALIPTEHARNDPHLSAGNRKAAKRTFPWEPKSDEIQPALPLPHDDDDCTRERKRRRLEELLPTSTNESPTENTTHDTTVALSAATATESDSVTDMHPNVMTAGAPRNYWTPAEDVQLTRAVTNTPKKKRGGIDWVAISAQVSGRTTIQCHNRWHRVLDSRTNLMTAGAPRNYWTPAEDEQLTRAVTNTPKKKRGGIDWVAISAQVSGRTTIQCHNRWHKVLDPSMNPTASRRTGKWKEDEDIELKDAVHKHGGKDWPAIAILVPGRTAGQCQYRWHDVLDPSIALATSSRTTTLGRSGTVPFTLTEAPPYLVDIL